MGDVIKSDHGTLFGDLNPTRTQPVTVDNELGANAAIEHLYSLGDRPR